MAEKQFDNVKINVGFSEEQELKELKSGDGLSVLMGKLAKAVKDIISHFADGVKHITADERTAWSGKADKSEIPNQNLLDNPDFKINQCGKSEYSNQGYTVDRWLLYRAPSASTIGSFTIIPNGIKITSGGTINDIYLIQILSDRVDYTGKTVTLSFEVSELSGAFKFNQRSSASPNYYTIDKNGVHKFTFTWSETLDPVGKHGIIVFNTTAEASMKLHWIKLEFGEVATPFIPPNPMVEALKCTPPSNSEQKILFGNGVWGDIPSNHNLLDNPDFKINQRGKTEYTGQCYTVDRWRAHGDFTIVTKTEHSIQITGNAGQNNYIEQCFEERPIGDVTITVRYKTQSNCTLELDEYPGPIVKYNLPKTNEFKEFSAQYSIATSLKRVVLNIPTTEEGTLNVDRVKLEYGNMATPFISPNYTLELLKCQRYCIAITGDSEKAYTMSPSQLWFHVGTHVPMRVSPSIENGVTPVVKTYGTSQITDGFSWVVYIRTFGGLSFQATKESHGIPVNTGGILMIPSGERLILSADL